jgi:hypothetical protein
MENGDLPDELSLSAAKQLAEDFIKQHPLIAGIWIKCFELQREMRSKHSDSLERKQLEGRYRKLLGYVDLRLYEDTNLRENFLRAFETSLTSGQFRWKGRVTNWENRKELMNNLAKETAKRPVGNPLKYRNKVTEALEMKILHSDWTWRRIADELDLEAPLEDLNRQINILEKLLLKEQIIIPKTP